MGAPQWKTILPLRNPIRRYAWGSSEAIARLQGRPTPTGEPEAALWMGAHPRAGAPSEAWVEGRWQRLDALIQRDPPPVCSGRASRGPSKRAYGHREQPFRKP